MLRSSLKSAALALGLVLAAIGPIEPSSAAGKATAKRAADAPAVAEDADPLTPTDDATGMLLAPGAPTAQGPIDPAAVADPIVVEVKRQLAEAKPRRAPGETSDQTALAAFYAEGDGKPVWVGAEGLSTRGRQAMDELAQAGSWGLDAKAFALPTVPPAGTGNDALADVEIKLGLAVLTYARHARGGRLDPQAVSRLFDQKPRIYEPKSLLRAVAATEAVDTYLRGLHPKHAQFERLRQAYLAETKAAPVTETGTSRRTSPDMAQRILVNMERWRWMPDDLGEFHVWDSIPEQMARVYKGTDVVFSERIVVGKTITPTPVFSAKMQFIIFHPDWGVPKGIKSNELAPMLRRADTTGGWFGSGQTASDVLERVGGLRATIDGRPVNPDQVNWAAIDINRVNFTQPPGARNVLGIVKFRFPNKHDVYMHDTPQRDLFAGSVRAFSHGCMRVQNPVKLAEVLLAHDKGWSVDKVQGLARGGSSSIMLDKPIPVHITYFTATVDEAGKLQTRADLYGLDNRMASALAGRSIQLVGEKVERDPAVASDPGQKKEPRSRVAKRGNGAAADQPFNPFSGLFGN